MNNNDKVRYGQSYKNTSYAGLDYLRIIAAFLIVAIHTSPLMSFSPEADFIFTRIIARVAVPFFFMVTGFFLLSRIIPSQGARPETDTGKPAGEVKKFLKKTAILYGAAILIYFPINIYSGFFNEKHGLTSLLKDIFINGTFYHLWYLPAVITGVILIYILTAYFGKRNLFLISLLLYGIGLLGDSYYGLTIKLPWLKNIYDSIFYLFDYTRNGIFYAPVFLVLGALIAKQNRKLTLKQSLSGLLFSSALLFLEGLVLHHNNLQRHDSMYLFLIPVMYYLFKTALLWQGRSNKNLRTLSMVVYITHPLAIIVVRGVAKVLSLEKLLITNSLLHYLAVCILSYIWGLLYLYITNLGKQENPDIFGRAWIEINLTNLIENAKELKAILPKDCTLMAVVKANAYGHGDIRIARELNKNGIYSFAVATLAEAVDLRRSGIKGEILIFGYTHPQDFKYLVKYDLIQTVVDYEYAQTLNGYGRPVSVHIKIDTGMHRLGENYNNVSNLAAIFRLENLRIKGTFTHLSVSDSNVPEDISFTGTQITHFYDTVQKLKDLGLDPGRLHIQSSYGVLNYPQLKCDYARIGIALYGVLSSARDSVKVKIHLIPVLSVKARIVMTKSIEKGDAVSYGRIYSASRNRKIATVTIGYADGIPRNLEGGYVLVKGRKAPIVGRICMDQLMIDITDIPETEPDDIVTVIGTEGDVSIRAEEIATNSGTITNELLTRLGNRLNRTYVR